MTFITKRNTVGSAACACVALLVAVFTERVAVGIYLLNVGTLEYVLPVLFLAMLISLWTAAAVGGVVGEWLGAQARWTAVSALVALAVFVRFCSCLAEYAFDMSSAGGSSDLVIYGAFVLASGIGLLTAHSVPRAHTSIGRSIRLMAIVLLSALILLVVLNPILKGEYQWANHMSERVQALGRELAAARVKESRTEDKTGQAEGAPKELPCPGGKERLDTGRP
jgi:hypothetical protein